MARANRTTKPAPQPLQAVATKSIPTEEAADLIWERMRAFLQEKGAGRTFELFQDMDPNGNGKIDLPTLMSALVQMGIEKVSNDVGSALMLTVNPAGGEGGQIEYSELLALLHSPRRSNASEIHGDSLPATTTGLTPEGSVATTPTRQQSPSLSQRSRQSSPALSLRSSRYGTPVNEVNEHGDGSDGGGDGKSESDFGYLKEAAEGGDDGGSAGGEDLLRSSVGSDAVMETSSVVRSHRAEPTSLAAATAAAADRTVGMSKDSAVDSGPANGAMVVHGAAVGTWRCRLCSTDNTAPTDLFSAATGSRPGDEATNDPVTVTCKTCKAQKESSDRVWAVEVASILQDGGSSSSPGRGESYDSSTSRDRSRPLTSQSPHVSYLSNSKLPSSQRTHRHRDGSDGAQFSSPLEGHWGHFMRQHHGSRNDQHAPSDAGFSDTESRTSSQRGSGIMSRAAELEALQKSLTGGGGGPAGTATIKEPSIGRGRSTEPPVHERPETTARARSPQSHPPTLPPTATAVSAARAENNSGTKNPSSPRGPSSPPPLAPSSNSEATAGAGAAASPSAASKAPAPRSHGRYAGLENDHGPTATAKASSAAATAASSSGVVEAAAAPNSIDQQAAEDAAVAEAWAQLRHAARRGGGSIALAAFEAADSRASQPQKHQPSPFPLSPNSVMAAAEGRATSSVSPVPACSGVVNASGFAEALWSLSVSRHQSLSSKVLAVLLQTAKLFAESAPEDLSYGAHSSSSRSGLNYRRFLYALNGAGSNNSSSNSSTRPLSPSINAIATTSAGDTSHEGHADGRHVRIAGANLNPAVNAAKASFSGEPPYRSASTETVFSSAYFTVRPRVAEQQAHDLQQRLAAAARAIEDAVADAVASNTHHHHHQANNHASHTGGSSSSHNKSTSSGTYTPSAAVASAVQQATSMAEEQQQHSSSGPSEQLKHKEAGASHESPIHKPSQPQWVSSPTTSHAAALAALERGRDAARKEEDVKEAAVVRRLQRPRISARHASISVWRDDNHQQQEDAHHRHHDRSNSLGRLENLPSSSSSGEEFTRGPARCASVGRRGPSSSTRAEDSEAHPASQARRQGGDLVVPPLNFRVGGSLSDTALLGLHLTRQQREHLNAYRAANTPGHLASNSAEDERDGISGGKWNGTFGGGGGGGNSQTGSPTRHHQLPVRTTTRGSSLSAPRPAPFHFGASPAVHEHAAVANATRSFEGPMQSHARRLSSSSLPEDHGVGRSRSLDRFSDRGPTFAGHGRVSDATAGLAPRRFQFDSRHGGHRNNRFHRSHHHYNSSSSVFRSEGRVQSGEGSVHSSHFGSTASGSSVDGESEDEGEGRRRRWPWDHHSDRGSSHDSRGGGVGGGDRGRGTLVDSSHPLQQQQQQRRRRGGSVDGGGGGYYSSNRDEHLNLGAAYTDSLAAQAFGRDTRRGSNVNLSNNNGNGNYNAFDIHDAFGISTSRGGGGGYGGSSSNALRAGHHRARSLDRFGILPPGGGGSGFGGKGNPLDDSLNPLAHWPVGPIDVRFRYGTNGEKASSSYSSALHHQEGSSRRRRGDAGSFDSGLGRSRSLDRHRAMDQHKQERLHQRLGQAYALAGGDFRACSSDRSSLNHRGEHRRGGGGGGIGGAEDPSRYLGLPVALAAAMQQGELQAKQLRAIRTQVETRQYSVTLCETCSFSIVVPSAVLVSKWESAFLFRPYIHLTVFVCFFLDVRLVGIVARGQEFSGSASAGRRRATHLS